MLRHTLVALSICALGCIPLDLLGAGTSNGSDRERSDDGEGEGETGEGEGETGEGEGEGEGGEGEGGEGEGEGEASAPRIVQLSANRTSLHEGDEVLIAAIVTDSDGIDDVIGGTLVDPASGASYGAFATEASEGAYQLTISWEAINVVAPIDFVASATRTVRARFFDVAAHVAEQDLLLTLSCLGDAPACDGACHAARCDDGACAEEGVTNAEGQSVCDGACVDFSSSGDDCGSCGHGCLEGCTTLPASSSSIGDPTDWDAPPAGVCSCESSGCPDSELCFDGICIPMAGINLGGDTTYVELDVLVPDQQYWGICNLTQTEATLLCDAVSPGTHGVSTEHGGAVPFGMEVDLDCAGATRAEACTFTKRFSRCSATGYSCEP